MRSPGQSSARAGHRLLLAAVLALAGLVLAAGPASAHATLISSDPAEGAVVATAPEQVTFTFDEPVRATSNSVRLFDATGKELEAEAKTRDTRLLVDLPGDLGEGTFIVAWRAVSSDGHPIGGALTFSIGSPSATVAANVSAPAASPAEVQISLGIAQAVTYLGVFGAGGLVIFVLVLLPRVGGVEQLRTRLLGLSAGFGYAVVVAGALTLVLTMMYQRGQGFGTLFGAEPLEIPAGTESLGYLLAVLGTWIAVLGARRSERAPYARRVALGGVAVALVSLGLVGHSRAFPPLWLMLTSDLIHVAAGTIWFGGLLGLAISLRRLAERPRTAADLLGRFSVLAAWLLVGVAVSGSILGWRILGSWDALLETDFGRLLLVKIAVVVLVVAAAAWNRYRLLPAVLADSGFSERGAAASRMQRAVRFEAALLVGVLGLTGFLVDRSPVPDQGALSIPGGFDDSTFTGQFDDVRVIAVVEPASVGKNEILFQLQDLAGNPLEPARPPGLSVAEGELVLGDQAVTNVDSGTYRATVLIPRPGTWTLALSVPLSEFDNPVVTVKVPLAASR